MGRGDSQIRTRSRRGGGERTRALALPARPGLAPLPARARSRAWSNTKRATHPLQSENGLGGLASARYLPGFGLFVHRVNVHRRRFSGREGARIG